MSDAPDLSSNPDGDSSGDLGGKVRRGATLSLMNSIVIRFGNVLSGIVIARLLLPEDYGTYAIALVVLSAMLSLNEGGISLALVRWPEDPRTVAPTVLTMATASSAAFFITAQLLAPSLATWMGDPGATGAIRLISVGVLIDGLTAASAALVTREFGQGRRLAADGAHFVVSTSITIVLALEGAGAWSLVIGHVAGAVTSAVLLWRLAPLRVGFGYDRAIARRLIAFGLPLAGASLLVFAVLNADYVIAGAILGPTELGLYLLAFNVASWPVSLLSTAARRVAFPAFSRLADDPVAGSAAFVRILRSMMVIALPSGALLAVLASPLILTLYGENWAAAAEPLRLLAYLGIVRVVTELTHDYLVARGHSRLVLLLQAGWLILLVPGLVVGTKMGGISGTAAAHLLVAVAVLPVFALVVRSTGVALREVGQSVLRPIAASAVSAAIAGAVASQLATPPVALVVAGTAGGLAYLLIVRRLLADLRPRFAS